MKTQINKKTRKNRTKAESGKTKGSGQNIRKSVVVKASKKESKEVVINIEDLKTDKRFENLIPITRDQLGALEQTALYRREVYIPIFIWAEKDIVIDGYPYLKILKAHPSLKYTLKAISFSDWQEAMYWVIEHNISRTSLTLWQKLNLAFQCPAYWEIKARAKKNQGCTRPVQSKDRIDTLQAIADTVGCSRTTVANLQRILRSGKQGIIEKCRKGEMSINAAYEKLFPSKLKKTNPKTKEEDMPIEMVTEDCNVFEECENGIDVSKKNTIRYEPSPVDPLEIADKMQKEEVPDGAIWVVLHRDKGAMQVVKKSIDRDRGIIQIKVNAYKCRIRSAKEGIVIFEASHLSGSTSELLRKDESEFKRAVG